jgi:hypothetical protein
VILYAGSRVLSIWTSIKLPVADGSCVAQRTLIFLLSGVSNEDLTWSVERRLYGTSLERGEHVLAASMAGIG